MIGNRRKTAVIVALCFYPFIIYFTLKAAPYITKQGAGYMFSQLADDIENTPYKITLCRQTPKAVLGVSFLYLIICAASISSMRNYRHGEEHGSARWATVRELNKKYASKEIVFPEAPKWCQDMILTNRARMGYDFWREEHQKNANTLIIGGPGTWKSRGYIIPNIMQMNCNMVITDPKGELAKKCGHMLMKHGYEVKVFDISNPENSICYNPFRYFRNDMDILDFVNNFFDATEKKDAMKGEKFWDDMAKNLMLAFATYLFHEAPEEEQNIPMILEMLHLAEVKDDNDDNMSPIDLLFHRLEQKNPNHIAVGYYKDYHKGSGKTLQSIQSTLSSKLAYFNMDVLKKLTVTDDIDIHSFATKKVALFCVTPDSKQSLNFLIGTLYQQMFQQLYDLADNVYDGPLPIHIRFMMDEFANIALPDDYSKILSTARSRNMSFVIVLQDKSQIEKIFETLYKTLLACCSEWLFLGSNEKETCEYFADLVGKETIYVKSYTRNYGAHGGYSVQISPQERYLMDPGEMRRKANRLAILIIEGEHALADNKYNMKMHRNYKYIAEGKNLKRKEEPAKIYDWGSTERATGICAYAGYEDLKKAVNLNDMKNNLTVYTDETIDYFAA